MRRLCALLIGVAACASPGPRDVLQEYAEAVRAGDARAIWRLSDSGFQRAHDPGAVKKWLDAAPEARARLVALAEAPRGSERESCTLELPGGARVRMVKEGGEWRVSSGGVELASCKTPRAALETLFRAVESGRLQEARCAIPARFAIQLATEEALSAHVEAMRPRVEAARKRLPADASPAIDGSRAEIVYGAGLAVRFEREDGEWRIVDVD